MTQKLQKLSWAVIGFTAGWFAVGWVGLSNYCDTAAWKDGKGCDLLRMVHDWQELIAGLAAIGAAYIGGSYILRQIEVTKDQIELAKEQALDNTRRRHAAARAMLPLALASITEYASACARQLKSSHLNGEGEAVPRNVLASLQIPALPMSAIAELKALVESADETLQLAIADLLAEIQVLSSRLSGLKEPRDPSSVGVVALAYLEDVIINSLNVYARSSSLFEYGRRKADTIPAGDPSPDMQFSAMHNLGFFDDRFSRIRGTISRRASRVSAPRL